MTNEHTSLEKYTSHTLFVRVACEGRVGDWTDCNILTPSSPDYSSTFFSFCWAAQPGVLRAQALCWEPVLTASNYNSNSNCNWLQLTRTVCGTGLYNCLMSICFLWASHLHRIQPIHMSRWYLWPHAPVSRLTVRSKVNMLHAEQILDPFSCETWIIIFSKFSCSFNCWFCICSNCFWTSSHSSCNFCCCIDVHKDFVICTNSFILF